MLLVEWEPGEAALEEVSSLVDMGHVKFVRRHLETLGIVMEVEGSDQPLRFPHLSLSNVLPTWGL